MTDTRPIAEALEGVLDGQDKVNRAILAALEATDAELGVIAAGVRELRLGVEELDARLARVEEWTRDDALGSRKAAE